MAITAWVSACPLGWLRLEIITTGALRRLGFEAIRPADVPRLAAESTVARALAAYFAGDLRALERLDVAPVGTPFQLGVWSTLRQIPAGSTWSYTELAARTGSVARAVGSANGANPVALVIPCHRVIGARGDLVGYAGGLEIKRALLRHEGALLL